MDTFIFEDLPGYKLYEDGNFFSVKRNKFLKITHNSKGYKAVDICVNGFKSKKLIHRLLAKAFIPNPHNKPQVNHINGIKTDNRLHNLEWCTSSENNYHAYKINLKLITKKQRESSRRNMLNYWESKRKL
jgi:hypothetical protein